jgi:hypothetical protein
VTDGSGVGGPSVVRVVESLDMSEPAVVQHFFSGVTDVSQRSITQRDVPDKPCRRCRGSTCIDFPVIWKCVHQVAQNVPFSFQEHSIEGKSVSDKAA